jgi:hypothetical protein
LRTRLVFKAVKLLIQRKRLRVNLSLLVAKIKRFVRQPLRVCGNSKPLDDFPHSRRVLEASTLLLGIFKQLDKGNKLTFKLIAYTIDKRVVEF